MNNFVLIFLAIFIVALISCCTFKPLKTWCAKQFETDWFKALRLAITLFGIIGAILGYLTWHHEVNKNMKCDISFELPSYYKKFIDAKENQEIIYQYAIENDIIYNPFFMCFYQGWQPVITITDKDYNAKLTDFGKDKGTLFTKDELNKILQPNKSTANISDFYLPPKARFSIKRRAVKGHNISEIIISNNRVNLTLEIAASFKNSICDVKVTYTKKWLLRVFYDNFDYDNWYDIICDRLKHKQQLSQEINQKDATSATGGINMYGSMVGEKT